MNFINTFMQSVMDAINSVVGNYGWSIVVFTILIKLVLLPLDYRSKKASRKMGKAQIKINEINEKYKDNADMRNQKTMELYKAEGINPLGQCLPLLLSWPVLIALFAVLRAIGGDQILRMFESVQAGAQSVTLEGWLWIKNIWQPDALNLPDLTSIPLLGGFFKGTVIPQVAQLAQYSALKPITETYATVMQPIINQFAGQHNGFFILPILAAVTQFFQTLLMNKSMGVSMEGSAAAQTKMMTYFMPLFSLWICSTYNAAFSIYWVTSNLFMILQQFVMDKYFQWKESQVVPDPNVKDKASI